MLTILSFVVVLGLLIFVHELGHFLVAKWAGVRVEVFSLGFGPRLLSVVRGDTEYCICAIPLGGYVKMTGQDDMPGEGGTKLTGADYEFPSKPWWKRLLIALAGPGMNFVAAFVIFYGAFLILGIPERVTNYQTATDVIESYPAAAVLQPGDQLTAVNGKPVRVWSEVMQEIQAAKGDQVELQGTREGDSFTAQVAFKIEENGDRRVGIFPADPAVMGEIHQDQQLPPENRHLRPGDEIQAVGAQRIKTWNQFQKLIEASPKTPVSLRLLRREAFEIELLTSTDKGQELIAYGARLGADGRVESVEAGSRAEDAGLRAGDVILSQKHKPIPFFKKLFRKIRGEDVSETMVVGIRRESPFELTVTPVEDPLRHRGLLGVEKQEKFVYHRFEPLESLKEASSRFVGSSMLVFVILKRLLTADIPASTLAGPVGIMQVTGKQAQKGLMDLLMLAAMLSVNLAIVNLLPIPILDGSHIVLCLIEGVRRKPVSVRIQGILQYIGLLILLPFILYVTFNDIIRWIRDIIG